jgi:site-specific DNA-methyltransferase (adenine-specific)
MKQNEIYLGDCLELMPQIATASINSIIADIPYFYLYHHSWDKQWKDLDEYKIWLESILVECKRILKPNGCIVVFSSQELNDVVGGLIRKHFYLLSNMVWDKTHAGGAEKGVKCQSTNKPVSRTERFIMAAHSENPLGDRIRYLLKTKNKTQTELVKYCVGKVTGLVGLWLCKRNAHGACEPTSDMWGKVCNFFEVDNDYKKHARVFNTSYLPYDIITMPPVNGLHPCEKPIELMKSIIQAVTNEGDLILDFTCGGGTTCLASKELNRNYIGIDNEQKYVDIAKNRIDGTI